MPDVFVPWDSTYYTDFYVDLLSRGLFNDFVLDFVDQEREDLLKKYPLFEEFNSRFHVDSRFLSNFLRFAKQVGVEPREHELEYSDELIRFQLKALIARNLYEFKSYFQVLTSFDDGFRKAVEVLSDERFFVELVNN
ncbi:MAG: hypothetical protein R2759_10635 [Bacteroidales bacterium]